MPVKEKPIIVVKRSLFLSFIVSLVLVYLFLILGIILNLLSYGVWGIGFPGGHDGWFSLGQSWWAILLGTPLLITLLVWIFLLIIILYREGLHRHAFGILLGILLLANAFFFSGKYFFSWKIADRERPFHRIPGDRDLVQSTTLKILHLIFIGGIHPGENLLRLDVENLLPDEQNLILELRTYPFPRGIKEAWQKSFPFTIETQQQSIFDFYYQVIDPDLRLGEIKEFTSQPDNLEEKYWENPELIQHPDAKHIIVVRIRIISEDTHQVLLRKYYFTGRP